MFLSSLAAGLLLSAPMAAASAVAPVGPTDSSVRVGDERAIKIIALWLKHYRRGKYDVSRQEELEWLVRRGRWPTTDIGKDSLIRKHKLIPADFSGLITYVAEIDLLCRQARELETAAAAKAILAVAAVGLDRNVRYTDRMVPATVRGVGAKHLAKFSASEVHTYLVAAAGGETGGAKKFAPAMQAAALRALGALGLSAHREWIAKQLANESPVVRAAAAHALGAIGEKPSIEALAGRLSKEGDDAAICEILDAIDRIHGPQADKRASEIAKMRMAVTEAGNALGRTDSFGTDLLIVAFLEKYRSKHSIDKLITLLERYVSEPKLVKSGRLSGRLRLRAHETLVSLSGSRISMTEPGKWRAFWTGAAATFKLVEKKKAAGKDDTVTNGEFFNIPVEGKRIVFVVDVSGSMTFPMRGSALANAALPNSKKGTTRMAILKQELWKTVEGLPADTQFKVISYNQKVTPWNKKLVYATKSSKKRFKKWLDGQKGQGATNIYGAMKLAMFFKSLVYGQHYESSVDEIFFLSDGFPTAGEVTDPKSILEMVTDRNQFSKVKINTIFLGPARDPDYDPNGLGMRLMKDVAKKNGGEFVQPKR